MREGEFRGQARTAVWHLAWMLAGGLAVQALALGVLASRPDWRLEHGSVEERKYARLREESLDYDLVFVGTSRVYRGFDPAVFDARCAELGHPLRSFNFGLVGMGYLEAYHTASWIVAQRSPRLRVLLVDPSDRESDLESYVWGTGRDVLWHDPPTTARGIALAWRYADPAERRDLVGLHLRSALRRASNLGVGANLLGRLLDPSRPAPLEDEGFGAWERGRKPLEAPEEPANPARRQPRPTPAPWETMQAIETGARAAGLRVLFVIPPTGRPLGVFKDAHEQGVMSELLTFEPDLAPRLFQGRNFYDAGHLNERGARAFSRLLAELIVVRLSEER